MSLKKIVDRVSATIPCDMKKKDIKIAVEETLLSMVDLITEGEKINIYGFGSFSLDTRKARSARNPLTGEMIDIPPRKFIRFRMSNALKEKFSKMVVED